MKKVLQAIFSIKNSENRKHKVITILGIKIKLKSMLTHDFSLNSGERQTSTSIEGIRKDHVYRYEKGIEAVKKYMNTNNTINGADIFCGNGYGTSLISNSILAAKMLSIDGSKDAIKLAEQYYSNKNTVYKQKIFPFKLKKESCDFIFSLESIEHVKDDKLFLDVLTSAIKNEGLLILSTPNIDKIDLHINPNHFHQRHYKSQEIIELLKSYNFNLIELYGQDTYIINEQKVCIGVLNPEDMKLKQDYYDGQFIIYIFKKIIEQKR